MKRLTQHQIDFMRAIWPDDNKDALIKEDTLIRRVACELGLIINQRDLLSLKWRHVDFLTWQIVYQNRSTLKVADIPEEAREPLSLWRDRCIAGSPWEHSAMAVEDIPVLWDFRYSGHFVVSKLTLMKFWREFEFRYAVDGQAPIKEMAKRDYFFEFHKVGREIEETRKLIEQLQKKLSHLEETGAKLWDLLAEAEKKAIIEVEKKAK